MIIIVNKYFINKKKSAFLKRLMKYSIKGRPVKKNPNLRDLNMGDYNAEIDSIQHKLKLLKRTGGCADFMKPYFKEFVELYKSLPKPILL